MPDRRSLFSRNLTRAGAAGIFLLAGVVSPWSDAAAATRYVDDDTCPAAGSGTLASPYCRIQDAVCAALAGDTVSVAPGIYSEAVRMRPGVSLVSQGGAAATTINASGRPCTHDDYCTKRTGNQCSVVTFASGHTTSTVLEGFTLTGGAGLIQTNHVAGGGIFVFSSPTIVNNVITNNVLSGPRREYRGAGVYVSVGSPVITGNTISGNRAVPGPGTQTATTYGYGGGIWVNFNTGPVITNNVIQGNQAGDPAAGYSLGAGGGIVVFAGDSSHPGPRIDRNLIADNTTDTLGGGVSLNSLPNTGALAAVTNNVIVGNSAKNGGGVYTYFSKSATVNNTIADNDAFLGGGLYSGQSEPALSVAVTNNVIVGNRINPFGDGGGIYTLDLSATFDPLISFNDLWGNERNQIAGEQTDATILGANGNFSADPIHVNPAARDFHLDPYSPAIDRADAQAAPPVDRDGAARGQDGDGVPDSPRPGDVDVGAYEAVQACGLDTDGDSLLDCVDPDDDNDGVADLSDCAPLDSGVSALPLEILNLQVTGDLPAEVTFDTQVLGTSARYEVLVGLLSRLHARGGFQELFCAESTVTAGRWPDPRPDPPAGDGWYYLVRAFNGCGGGTLGSAAADMAGAGDACEADIVDFDADGSPSDLDCNDGDPATSPLAPEVCDGLDNDCSGTPDDNVPDTDGDGMNNCADPDDDGDGVGDAADCAPLSSGAWGTPTEVQGVEVAQNIVTEVTWQVQPLGPDTVYEVASGLLAQPGSLDFQTGGCAGPARAAPPLSDGRPDPPPDQAWYYMVKSRNICGAGTFGTPMRDRHPACP